MSTIEVRCARNGAFAGSVPLLRKIADGRGSTAWAPRLPSALAIDLGFGYGLPVKGDRLADRLGAVAKALNDDDIQAAQIALAELRLPAFPQRKNGRLAPQAQARLARALRDISLLAEEERPLARGGFDPAQARVPPGNGRASGEWAADGNAPTSSPAATASTELAAYKPVHSLPRDAIVVTPSDGKPIEDPSSPTGKLMAPPRADFRQVYAAGQAVASLPLGEQERRGHAAIAQEGTFDFQRDKAHQKEYLAYVNASNYAAGVYMAGAGHSLVTTLAAAEAYAFRHSSNYGALGQIMWVKKGWKDAAAGRWK